MESWQWWEWSRLEEKKRLGFFSLCYCDGLANSVTLHFLEKKLVPLWEVFSYRWYSSRASTGLSRTCILAAFPFLMSVGKGEICFMAVWLSSSCKAIPHPPVLSKCECSWWNKAILLALLCSGKQPWSMLLSLGIGASLWFCHCPSLQCSSPSPLIRLLSLQFNSLLSFPGNSWIPGLPYCACYVSSNIAERRDQGAGGAPTVLEIFPFPWWAPRGAYHGHTLRCKRGSKVSWEGCRHSVVSRSSQAPQLQAAGGRAGKGLLISA